MRARFSVVAVLLLLASVPASAQLPKLPQFDLDHLSVDSSAAGSLVVGTGEILPVGAVRFSLAGDYQNNPYQYVDPTGAVASIISDRYTVHVVGGFAPVEWLEVGMDVPIVASQNAGDGIEVALPGVGVVHRALGSPTISARGAMLFQSKGAPFDVAFQLGAKIPIGSASAFVSDGKIGLSPKLMIGRNLDWARAGLELGALWRPNNTTVSSSGDPTIDTIGSSLLVAGVLSGGPQTGLRGEISGRTYVTLDGKIGSVELLLGARYPIAPNMEVYALAGPGLGEAAGTPKWRVMVGAAFGNGQGITGTPLPGEGALQTPPGGTAPAAPQGPPTTTPPVTDPTQTPPSNPFPPFTPPPGIFPPGTQSAPPDQNYPPPQQPTYQPPPPQAYPPQPPAQTYPPQPPAQAYPPDTTSAPPPPPPSPTYAPPPPPPAHQATPPPPPPEPSYNTYPTGH